MYEIKKIVKKNWGLIISSSILILVSIVLSAYDQFGIVLPMTEQYYCFYILLIATGIGIMILITAYSFGDKVLSKYSYLVYAVSTILVIVLGKITSGNGLIIAGCIINFLPLLVAIISLSISSFLWWSANKSIYFTLVNILMLIIGIQCIDDLCCMLCIFIPYLFTFISLYKNKMFSGKAQTKKTIHFIALSCLGIALVSLLVSESIFYYQDYSSINQDSFTSMIWDTLSKVKMIGAIEGLQYLSSPRGDYLLLSIFVQFGYVAGIVVLALLIAFMIGMCRKAFSPCNSSEKPTLIAAGTILLTQFAISLLANFGIRIPGLNSSIPFLSFDGINLIATLMFLGLLLKNGFVDIHSKRAGFAGRLSNFTKRKFIFDDVPCNSIEGVLQSFKFKDENIQTLFCRLPALDAKLMGQKQDWQTDQLLYWKGKIYMRDSKEYQILLDRLYWTVYVSDKQFRKDVKKAFVRDVRHSIGHSDIKETILTEEEFISRLQMTIIRASLSDL